MVVKSIIDCLNRVDNMIFGKSLECQGKSDLEDIRSHLQWQQADVIARGECIEERVSVLSVLSQINHIIEKFYSDGDEEDLDEQYNTLGQKISEWYGVINAEADKNQQIVILYNYYFHENEINK